MAGATKANTAKAAIAKAMRKWMPLLNVANMPRRLAILAPAVFYAARAKGQPLAEHMCFISGVGARFPGGMLQN